MPGRASPAQPACPPALACTASAVQQLHTKKREAGCSFTFPFSCQCRNGRLELGDFKRGTELVFLLTELVLNHMELVTLHSRCRNSDMRWWRWSMPHLFFQNVAHDTHSQEGAICAASQVLHSVWMTVASRHVRFSASGSVYRQVSKPIDKLNHFFDPVLEVAAQTLRCKRTTRTPALFVAAAAVTYCCISATMAAMNLSRCTLFFAHKS